MTSALDDLVSVGGDLEPATVLEAYRSGRFPMHIKADDGHALLCWWDPDPRAVIDVDAYRPSRWLRRARNRFDITVDHDFALVVEGCADPSRPHGWINDDIRAAYSALFDMGFAHSIEARREGELLGGVYGVSLGGIFFAESMYHRATDASKAAMAALLDVMADAGPGRVIDVQWSTPHLEHLGAGDVPRAAYHEALAVALALPDVRWDVLAADET